jgi:hypothetical protein
MSHFGGSTHFADAESTSQYVGDDNLEERDVDASVRALRPRSSRRGSWESEASRWSARIQGGTPSLGRERSLWTSNSVRTGALSAENVDRYDRAEDSTVDTDSTTGAHEALSVEAEKAPRPVLPEVKESQETARDTTEMPAAMGSTGEEEKSRKPEDQTTPKEEMSSPVLEAPAAKADD